MENPSIGIAAAYVEGLKRKDLSGVPFDPDVRFESPLTNGPIRGVESLIEFLSGLLPAIRDARVKKSFGAGEDVCTVWELETTAAVVIPICEYFRVVDGRLKEIRPYYDPRPMVE